MVKKEIWLTLLVVLLLTGLLAPASGGVVAAAEQEPSAAFTVVVLPDTQGYSETNPEIFLSQTQWIVENRKELNIKLVVHLGDLVENPGSQEEWNRAKKAMNVLDTEEIPALVTFGNHDYTSLNGGRSSNPFNKYFPLSRYEGGGVFGGAFSESSGDNVFLTFEGGGEKYLFLTLEYRPRDEVLAWADRVLEEYADYRAILVTHSYMWPNGFRTNSGDDIWNEVAGEHENVRMVLCGHVPGEGVKVNYGENGNKVTQILSNYQYYSNGGNGFLRIMTFYPGKGEVRVRTYSPYLDSYKKDEGSEFVVDSRQ